MTTTGVYAYVHCKPNGTPFYVGKGRLRRAKKLSGRNQYHTRTVEKYGKENLLIGMLECSSDDIAFNLEIGMIKCLKNMDVKLTNHTNGGEGGKPPTEEGRLNMSDAAKKRGVSQACRDASKLAKTGVPLSVEQRLRQSITMTGAIFTDEHKRNISASAKKRGMSDACREAANIKRKKPVKGTHVNLGNMYWASSKEVSEYLNTPMSTTSKRIQAKQLYKGWVMEYMV
jgi:hypothetical protein